MSKPKPSPVDEAERTDPPPTPEPTRSRPVLASEALKDDLAPVDPWATAARYWCAAFGVVFIALVFTPAGRAHGAAFNTVNAHYILGGVALAAAALPIPYAVRAAVMVLVALATGVAGIAGYGPAGALAEGAREWGILHLLTAIGLPAALLFRARYRAYGGARLILVAALILALPFAVHALVTVTHGEELASRIASALALVTIGLSLLGFMGSETTGGGSTMAAAVVVVVLGQLSASTVERLAPVYGLADVLWSVASVCSFGGAAALGALGSFQLLAWRLAPEARNIDTRKSNVPEQRPRLITDWFIRK